MNCQQFTAFVDAMPLRERTNDQMEEVNRHTQQCSACAAHVDATRRLEDDLSRLPLAPPPVDLSHNVIAEVMRKAPPQEVCTVRPRPGLARWAVPLAGTAALVAGYVSWMRVTAWLGELSAQPGAVETALLGSMIRYPTSAHLVVWAGALLVALVLLGPRDRHESKGLPAST